MPRPAKYNLDNIGAIIAENNITKRGELQAFNASAYAAARKNGWLDQLLPEGETTSASAKRKSTSRTKAAKAPAAERTSKAVSDAVQKIPQGKQRARKRPTANGKAKRTVSVTLTGISQVGDLQDILALAKDRGLGVDHTFNEAA